MNYLSNRPSPSFGPRPFLKVYSIHARYELQRFREALEPEVKRGWSEMCVKSEIRRRGTVFGRYIQDSLVRVTYETLSKLVHRHDRSNRRAACFSSRLKMQRNESRRLDLRDSRRAGRSEQRRVHSDPYKELLYHLLACESGKRVRPASGDFLLLHLVPVRFVTNARFA